MLEVPADINSFDLGDVIKLLLRLAKEGSTVETCRPDQIIKFLEVNHCWIHKPLVREALFFIRKKQLDWRLPVALIRIQLRYPVC